jgi:hypothetical protein
VIASSTVRPLLDDELRSEEEKQAQIEFNRQLREPVGDFDPELINTAESVDNDEMEEPMDRTGTFLDDNDEPKDKPDQQQDDIASGPELLINAEIFLPHGDQYEIARVIGCK